MNNNSPETPSRGEYLLLLLALIAAALPFWTVSLPPAADLPQHLGQAWLLEQTLAGLRPELTVTPWFYPNTLVYWLLYGIWQIADPITTGKLALSLLAAMWVVSSWALARAYQRSFESWLIAAPLVFNFLFNWGFMNFLIGWPPFCGLLIVARWPASRNRNLGLLLMAFLLYYAHALWFGMATLWLASQIVMRKRGDRWSLAWPLLPTWLYALAWYPHLAALRAGSGVKTDMDWSPLPHERLGTNYLFSSMQGSLVSDLETIFCWLIVAWILAVVITRWRELREETCFPLLAAGGLMLLAFLLWPTTYMNTIFFNRRWMPFGMTLLLLALPPPRLPNLPVRVFGIGLLCLFSAVTVRQWKEWEIEQLDGFLDAIATLQPGERILGVNLNDGSQYVRGQPGLQLHAYAQVLRGAEPHFSFTEHYSGVVQFRQPRSYNPYSRWTQLRLTTEQVHSFDKVLVNGDDAMHAYARQRWHLVPVNDAHSNWRVYRAESP